MTFNTQSPTVATKVILVIPNYGIIPEGKQGAGNKAWTFIDEIIIRKIQRNLYNLGATMNG